MKNKFISAFVAVSLCLSHAFTVHGEGETVYARNEIYNIDFNNAVSTEITSSNNEVMLSWLPEGYARKLAISNSAADFSYGAVIAPIRMDNMALKVSSPAKTSAVVNNYLGITTVGMNPKYPDIESVSTGTKGYAELSFDFYTDFNSNIRFSVGRYYCADSNETISEINKQDLLYIRTNGKVDLFGTTLTTLDIEEYKNSWHNFRIIFKPDNTYRVFIDDAAVNEFTSVTYQSGYSFRGLKEIRLYNIGETEVSSNKYYDNIKYEVYTDVTDQYELPSVKFDDSTPAIINIEEGERYSLKVNADSICPEKIRIYVDGELDAEYDGGSCEYEYVAVVGEHDVEAEVEDTIGNVSERVKVTFTVSERVTIFGNFEDSDSGGIYSDTDERIVNFSASCDDGLDRVEFFVNGNMAYTSYDEETEFDFSEFGTGILNITAVVYNSLGSSKEFTYTATVTMDRISLLWSEDYSSYSTGSTKIGDNVQIYHKNGYSKAVTVDSEHGTSLALGIEQDLGSDSGEYVNFANSRGTAHVTFETEFYVSDYPADDAHIRLSMVQESTVQNSSFMIIGSTIYKGSTQMEYEPKTWNKLFIDFDMEQKKYSIYINGEPFVTNINLASEKPNFESLNYIRFYGPSKDGVPSYIAFDNTKMSVYESYSVTSVCGENEEITSYDKDIKVYLSEAINPESLTCDRVKIKDGDKELSINSVNYDEEKKCIIITLNDVLIGNKNYTVELSEELETGAGEKTNAKISASFEVKSGAKINILSAECQSDLLAVTLSTNSTIKAYVIVSAWDNNVFEGMAIETIEAEEGKINEVKVPEEFAQSGNKLQICIVESLADFSLLTDDIITVVK